MTGTHRSGGGTNAARLMCYRPASYSPQGGSVITVGIRILATTIAVAFWPVATRAQQFTVGAGTEIGTTINTRLEHLRFRTPLPFDVQFYVRAPIDADVEEVQGKVARKRTPTCDVVLDQIPTMPPSRSYRGSGIRVVPPRPPLGAPPTAATPAIPAAPVTQEPPRPRATPPAPGSPPGWLGYASIFPDDQNVRVFELSVPPLKPRKDYCFAFILRIETDPEEARALVVTALDEQLRALGGELPPSEISAYDAFRKNVIAALDALRERKERTKPYPLIIEVPADSFFNPEITADKVALNYRIQFSQLVQAQANRSDLLDGIVTRADEALLQVDAVARDERFKRMAAGLLANRHDPLIEPRLAAVGDLLTLTVAEARAIPLGATADTPPLVTRDIWTAAALDARIAELDRRIRHFTQLGILVQQLADNEALQHAVRLAPAAFGAAANPNALTADEWNTLNELVRNAGLALREVRGEMAGTQSVLAERARALAAMAEQIAAQLENDIRFVGTTMADWRTRATAYVSADVGLAYSEGIDSFFFYLGTNLYLGPVNRKAPLSFREDGLVTSIRKRVAVTFGIPLNAFDNNSQVTLADERVALEGVIASRPLLLGVGFRLTELVRFTAGTVFFKVKDPNPLIDDPRTRRTAFFSISVDWDVRGALGGLAGQTPAPQLQR